MRERGMIFNAEMVRAILSGSKTQTRRPMKSQPTFSDKTGFNLNGSAYGLGSCERETNRNFARAACPHGKRGDRIWVRETFGDCGERLVYRADSDDGAKCKVKHWAPSIHMPRWASRITLEITNVRVERLNAISEPDANAEGVQANTLSPARYVFGELWQSIYGADNSQSWQANPWVWVIEFKRVEATND